MCLVRPILNLAWNSITNGVYVLANYSECCVMLSRAHYLAIYENPIGYDRDSTARDERSSYRNHQLTHLYCGFYYILYTSHVHLMIDVIDVIDVHCMDRLGIVNQFIPVHLYIVRV